MREYTAALVQIDRALSQPLPSRSRVEELRRCQSAYLSRVRVLSSRIRAAAGRM